MTASRRAGKSPSLHAPLPLLPPLSPLLPLSQFVPATPTPPLPSPHCPLATAQWVRGYEAPSPTTLAMTASFPPPLSHPPHSCFDRQLPPPLPPTHDRESEGPLPPRRAPSPTTLAMTASSPPSLPTPHPTHTTASRRAGLPADLLKDLSSETEHCHQVTDRLWKLGQPDPTRLPADLL